MSFYDKSIFMFSDSTKLLVVAGANKNGTVTRVSRPAVGEAVGQ